MCTTHGDGGRGNDGSRPYPAGPRITGVSGEEGREGDGEWSERAGPRRYHGDQVDRN